MERLTAGKLRDLLADVPPEAVVTVVEGPDTDWLKVERVLLCREQGGSVMICGHWFPPAECDRRLWPEEARE